MIFFKKLDVTMVLNNSIDKTIQKNQLVSCFQYQIVLEHIAILDRQMRKPSFNNFEDNLFYLVKLVTFCRDKGKIQGNELTLDRNDLIVNIVQFKYHSRYSVTRIEKIGNDKNTTRSVHIGSTETGYHNITV